MPKFANIWRRIFAFAIDSIILTFVFFIFTLIFGIFREEIYISTALVSFSFLITFLYFIILEAKFGQTIGKKILKIKVVKENNEKITWKASILRNIFRFVDNLPLFYLVGIISILATKKKQRVGDLVAKTIVVKV